MIASANALLLLLAASPLTAATASTKGVRGSNKEQGRVLQGDGKESVGLQNPEYNWGVQNGEEGAGIGSCSKKEYVDVVIIGAGMAGLAAAATLGETDPLLRYVVLESTGRVGGRVRDHTFGVPGREYVVEDGANWISDFNGNPVWDMAEAQSLNKPFSNFYDYTVYDDLGNELDPEISQAVSDNFDTAFFAAGDAADGQWTSDHADFPDQGVLGLLAQHGWNVTENESDNVKYMFQWFNIDYEYATSRVSIRYFPYELDPQHVVTDQRGFASLIQDYAQNNVPLERINALSRVVSVNYDIDIIQNGVPYKAIVGTNDGTGCTDYYAQRVISTVSAGVLNNNLIEFIPTLTYPAAEYNPYEMTQYIKIFYQFEEKFWHETEFIMIARDFEHRGQCNQWTNMDHFNGIEGSGIIRCEIMTEQFNELIDPSSQELSEATILALLEPLRTVYGATVVGEPIDYYYPKLNTDPNFGFGAYANWKIGKTFTDFAKFVGGVDVLTDPCEHNGCNSNDEWILHIGGSATCYAYSEYVHGAYYSGQRNANFVLDSMGYDVKVDKSPCDMWWGDLK